MKAKAIRFLEAVLVVYILGVLAYGIRWKSNGEEGPGTPTEPEISIRTQTESVDLESLQQELDEVATEQLRLERIDREADALRDAIANRRAHLEDLVNSTDRQPERIAPGEIFPGLEPSEEWQDLGRGSPEDAFETYKWDQLQRNPVGADVGFQVMSRDDVSGELSMLTVRQQTRVGYVSERDFWLVKEPEGWRILTPQELRNIQSPP